MWLIKARTGIKRQDKMKLKMSKKGKYVKESGMESTVNKPDKEGLP